MRELTLAQAKKILTSAKSGGVLNGVQHEAGAFTVGSQNLTVSFECSAETRVFMSYQDLGKPQFLQGDYPSNPKNYTICAKELTYIAKAMAKNDIRYYLNGVAVYENGTFCATDGHRLHYQTGITGEVVGIIPRDLVVLILKFVRKGNIVFSMDDKLVAVDTDYFSAVAQLVDGCYPFINRFISVKGISSVHKTPTKQGLKSLLSTAKLFSPKYDGVLVKDKKPLFQPPIHKKQEDGSIRTEYKESEPVPHLCDIDLFLTVDGGQGFNASYLVDALSHGLSEYEALINTKGDPVKLTAGNLNAVIMPMRI